MEIEIKEKKVFKVKSLHRFLFAPTGRIYDPNDVFEVKNEADFDYLTKTNKLCIPAPKDAEVTETDQDRRDKVAIEAEQKELAIKKEVAEAIKEKFPQKELVKKTSKKK